MFGGFRAVPVYLRKGCAFPAANQIHRGHAAVSVLNQDGGKAARSGEAQFRRKRSKRSSSRILGSRHYSEFNWPAVFLSVMDFTFGI